MFPHALTLQSVLEIVALGFFFALGWSALGQLWSLLGERGKLIAAIVVLVVILVAVVLAYRGG